MLAVEQKSLSKSLTNASDKKVKGIVNDIKCVLNAKDCENKENIVAKRENKLSQPKNTTSELSTPYPGISKLSSSLFLCGAAAAIPANLEKLGVGLVINVAPELPDTPLSTVSKPLYLRINAQDRPEVDLMIYFNKVADMIEQVRQNGGKSLVHCVAGVSRSASLCIAYFIKYADMNLRDAYQHVKSIRPQIRPNSGFFQQLRRYELQQRGASSVQMIFFESLNKEIPDVLEAEYKAMEDFYQRYRSALKKR